MNHNRKFRVMDFSANCISPTHNQEIQINNRRYLRRVIDAPAYIAIIAETSGVTPGIDGWHCENPALAVEHDHHMAVLYTGDRKCSSSTWWNTGNPRNLVELEVFPLDHLYWTNKGQHTRALWRYLAERHPIATPHSHPCHPTAWFQASPEQLAETVLDFIGNRYDPYGRTSAKPLTDPRTMLYLAVEHGDEYVKLGKCAGGRTSPAERRVAMYAPGNPRGLDIVGRWVTTANVPERQLQKELRDECHRLGRRFRAEWFELNPDEAMRILERKLREFSLTAD